MRRGFLAVAALAALSCSGSWSQIDSGSIGHYSNASDAYVVVRTYDAWRFLYSWTHAGISGTVPSVDFAGDMVVAAFLGDRPSGGYAVDFAGATFAGENVTCSVTETVPTGPAIAIITRPFAFAKVTKHTGSVTVIKDGGAAATALARTYPQLAVDDYTLRAAAVDPWTTAPPTQLPALNSGDCPLDGTALVEATLPAAGTYTDLANTAWFCPSHGLYWVEHEQGALVGTVTVWRGPFTPGDY